MSGAEQALDAAQSITPFVTSAVVAALALLMWRVSKLEMEVKWLRDRIWQHLTKNGGDKNG